jgi:hypothetical protein
MTRKGLDMATVPGRAAMAGSGKTAARTVPAADAQLAPCGLRPDTRRKEAGVPGFRAADCPEEAAGQTQPPAVSLRAVRLARRTARRTQPAPLSAWPRPRPHGGTVRLPGQNRISCGDRDRPGGAARCRPPAGTPADRAQRTQRALEAQTTRHDHNVTFASSVTKLNIISMLALTNNCLATNVKHNRHAVQPSLKVTGSHRRGGRYLQQTFSEFRA